jgi:hypothetical protein
MAILVAFGLGVVALAFVLYPVYHRSASSKKVALESTEGETQMVLEQEQAARMALHEVELDYQLDNISDEDYNQLRERYIRRAAVALKVRYEQEHERERALDEEIEEQLRKLKEQEHGGKSGA